jgi:hypothetical protein
LHRVVNSRAAAAPMPALAPVINAILPFNTPCAFLI